MTAERGAEPPDPVAELRAQIESLSQRIEALQHETAADDEREGIPARENASEDKPAEESQPETEAPTARPEPGAARSGDHAGGATAPAPSRPRPATRYSALHAKLAALEEADRLAKDQEAQIAAAAEAPPADTDDDDATAVVAPHPEPSSSRPAPAIAVAATTWRDPRDPEAHRGVRYSDLSTIAGHEHRLRRAIPFGIVLALIAAAFAGGAWWAGRNDTGTVLTAEPVAPPGTVVTSDTQPAAPPSTAAPDVQDSTPSDVTSAPPPTTTPAAEPVPVANPATVVAAAGAALSEAGYSYVTAGYAGGTLILDGVLPAADVTDGYFALVDRIIATVAGIDGVQSIAPRLFLRGDDVALRAQLSTLSAARPIEFALGRAELSADSRATLAEAAAAILANPGLRVLVAGHTDALGTPESNAELAAARAAAVIQELVAQGVPITRLQPVSYGELFPDADLSAEQNRRVAFEVAP